MSKINNKNMSAVGTFTVQNAVVAKNPVFYPESDGKKCFISFVIYVNGWKNKQNKNVEMDNPTFIVSARGESSKILARSVYKGKNFSNMELKLQLKTRPKTYKDGTTIYEKDGSEVTEEVRYYDIISFALGNIGNKTTKDQIAKGLLSPYWQNSVPREKLIEAIQTGMTTSQLLEELDSGYTKHKINIENKQKCEFQHGNKYFGNAKVIYNSDIKVIDNKSTMFPGTCEDMPEKITVQNTGTAQINTQNTQSAPNLEKMIEEKLAAALQRVLGGNQPQQQNQQTQEPPPFEASGLI